MLPASFRRILGFTFGLYRYSMPHPLEKKQGSVLRFDVSKPCFDRLSNRASTGGH